jgi:patatin-like phospholipase/acyl hydrolase
MGPFRILSIDGGGLRGIVPVTILQAIEAKTGRKIYELFDMIAGTSTGGLIACALTLSDDGKTPKYTLQDIADMYTKHGKDIFPPVTGLKKVIHYATDIFHSRFSPDGLDKVLKDYMGDKTMLDCIRPLFIASYDIKNNEAILFKSRHAARNVNQNAKLHDICRATSAGPTYLPAYPFHYDGKDRICIDGGVYMNNPTVGAIVEVSRYTRESTYYDGFQNVPTEDIVVLSLGTGHYTNNVLYRKVDGGGELGWAPAISDVMMQGVNQVTDYEATELLEDNNYLRLYINISDSSHDDMADSSDETLHYLLTQTQQMLATCNSAIDKFLPQLMLPKTDTTLAVAVAQ